MHTSTVRYTGPESHAHIHSEAFWPRESCSHAQLGIMAEVCNSKVPLYKQEHRQLFLYNVTYLCTTVFMLCFVPISFIQLASVHVCIYMTVVC